MSNARGVTPLETNLAHDVAERPIAETHCGHDERDADEEAFVGHGQIENVQIGDRLHFGVTQYDVDDERVAHQSDDKDGSVQALKCGRVGM